MLKPYYKSNTFVNRYIQLFRKQTHKYIPAFLKTPV